MNRCDKAISNKLMYDPESSRRVLRKKSSKKSKLSSTSRLAKSPRGIPRGIPKLSSRRSLSRRGSGKSSVSTSRRVARSPDASRRDSINRSITSISNEVMRSNKNLMSGLNKTQMTSLKCILNDTLPDLMETALNDVTARRSRSPRATTRATTRATPRAIPRRSLSRRGSGKSTRRSRSPRGIPRATTRAIPRRSLSRRGSGKSTRRSRSPIRRRYYA